MQPNTLTRKVYTGTQKIHVKILDKIHIGSENHQKRRIRIRNKIIPDPKPAKDDPDPKKNHSGSDPQLARE
jgi:hypothetical protein